MTQVKRLEDQSLRPEQIQMNRDEEYERADFYEILFNELVILKEVETNELKKSDTCLIFDIWREPYRVGDNKVSETFMEVIIGKVENPEPLTLSEAISLDTYQDKLTYSAGKLTWSVGSRISHQKLMAVDQELFQKLKETLITKAWTKAVSYKREHVTTFVQNLKDYVTAKLPAKEKEIDFERARYYDPLVAILMNQERLETEKPEIGDDFVLFDIWREPYRVGDNKVSETFMEVIIGKVENPEPLTLSEAISLDTYQDKLTYSAGKLTWSVGSKVSPSELIPVNHELFQRIKIKLKPRKWEKNVSYNRRHVTTFVRNLENYFTGKYSGKNYSVVNKKVLVHGSNGQNSILSFELKAPEIAAEAAPGQFVVIRLHERGERIPMTITDSKKDEDLIRIIFQVVGKTTKELATVRKGEFILDLLGPLGNPIEIKKYDRPVICIAGGVGVASIYAKAKALKEKGNYIISIIGAKTKDILILEEEMDRISDELYVTTDDGSYVHTRGGVECLHRVRTDGSKVYGGFVSNVLEALLGQYKLLTKENERIENLDGKFLDYGPSQMVGKYPLDSVAEIIAVGPILMMRAIVDVVAGNGKYDPEKDYRDGLPATLVSLNPIMVDGTGLCGCCRVRIYNPEKQKYETKFACVDGPVFNGFLVDFESLLKRTIQYKPVEKKSVKYLEVARW